MNGRASRIILASGEYPFLAERLAELGFVSVQTAAEERIPAPIRFHPDMQACKAGKSLFVLRGSPLRDKLKSWGIDAAETEREPSAAYPRDVICNAFVAGRFFVGNPDTVDPLIRSSARKQGLKELAVRQGYAACSAAVVNGSSVITADRGIAAALEQAGIDVLRIRPGFVKLPGYDTGFFGGCCGLLTPTLMAFSGALRFHPDGNSIRQFLLDRNVEPLELRDEELLDVGGIVPLKG